MGVGHLMFQGIQGNKMKTEFNLQRRGLLIEFQNFTFKASTFLLVVLPAMEKIKQGEKRNSLVGLTFKVHGHVPWARGNMMSSSCTMPATRSGNFLYGEKSMTEKRYW